MESQAIGILPQRMDKKYRIRSRTPEYKGANDSI